MTCLDAAAKRSARRVVANGRASTARLEAAVLSDARRFGHHGVANLIETVRQRHNARITEAWARDLLARAGYPNPKP